MSIKEKYEALVAEQEIIREAEIRRIQDYEFAERLRREAAHRIWSEKKESEEPAVYYNLELKTVKLKRFGILRMIEEFTDCNIGTLYSRNSKFQVKLTPKQIKEWQERAVRHLRDFYGARWEVKPTFPKLDSETLFWENTDKVALDIRKEHRNMRNREPFRVTSTEHVDLVYDGAVLTIAGESEEFSGRIPQRKNQRIEIIESAFARAFFRPRIEVPELLQSSFREPDYNIPIGASL